ncbi:hypothetical protein GPJ56_008115 [Histomonas meleagridis]|uniref:uncharacterized protein n=1 Tax=Histomonas meleagridis TaxID=135588 RepID=UPI00355A6D24|nr:hypothetical protein GPJ56_008115 [Histomonas meleagridis]KAH0802044.1 hypothetical protein GO595_005125 [Histomonas meleagridis]
MYTSIVFQRIDVEVDSSLVSDLYYFLTQLKRPIKTTIVPLQPKLVDQTSKIISCNWLEMSSIDMILRYNRKGGRNATIHQMMKYLKYVPSIKEGRILLPGIVISGLQDSVKEISQKVFIEYKTAAFNQILQMLGTKGKILSTFGITSMVADMLGIKMCSDMSSDISRLIETQRDTFDNRRELNGVFSQQSLNALVELIKNASLTPSSLTMGLIENVNFGMQNKVLNGAGFGKGVLALFTGSVNPLKDVGLMVGVSRKRYPRAFLNNGIGVFDESVSKFQSFVQKDIQNETIRLAIKGDTQNVFITDTNIYLVSNDNKIRYMRIADLILLKVEGKFVVVKGVNSKEEVKLETENEEEAVRIELALSSMRNMIRLFGFSLLVES